MSFQERKVVLLTGAGFTHNFGGFLATKMGENIFNSSAIKSYGSIVRLLKEDQDYESAYHQVMYGDFSPEEQRAFTNAVTSAYTKLDKVLCEFTWGVGMQYPFNIYGVNRLIRRFAGKGNVRGYFFTLNQDLFIDRRFRHEISADDEHLTIPGLPHHLRNIGPAVWNRALTPEDYFRVPTHEEMEAIIRKNNGPLSSTGRFHYIKLHGSMNWLSSDGRGVLVIGRDKSAQIKREPLLKWYFETFKRVLSIKGTHLFITGYGFGDTHVNEVIANSIERQSLKLYAIYPEPFNDWRLKLLQKKHGQTILDALERYDSDALKDLYPADQSDKSTALEIESIIQQIP